MMLQLGRSLAVLTTLAGFLASSVAARAVEIGPIDLKISVLGVGLTIPASGSLDISSTDNTVAVALDAHLDLADLQANALPIAQALDLPRDNCARRDLNPVVDSIDSASIVPGPGNSAAISIGGHVTLWECARVFGTNVKTTIASDGLTLSGAVGFAGEPPKLVIVGDPQLSGSDIFDAIAGLFKGQIAEALRKSIGDGLDLSKAASEASDLLGEFHIDSASFGTEGDHLTLDAKVHTTLTADQLTQVLSAGH